jgi:hypothetical protein
VFEPIIVESGGYQAWTDGLTLKIALENGVVVGEGLVGASGGTLWVGEYEGKLDDRVRGAVAELFHEHQMDIAARRLAVVGGIAEA